MLELIARLWRGDITLPKAFWAWGAFGVFALGLVAQFVFMRLVMLGLISTVMFTGVLLTVLVTAYLVLASVGIWRSAGKYTGPFIWKYAARAVIIVVALVNTGYLVLAGMQMTVDTHDPERNSCNINDKLRTAPGYPYTGFWKARCSDNFGLAIEPHHTGLYSVSFCGPGGCFKPGSYRPNTTIEGDANYKVVDDRTIEVLGRDGFSRYHLCTTSSVPVQGSQPDSTIDNKEGQEQQRASNCRR